MQPPLASIRPRREATRAGRSCQVHGQSAAVMQTGALRWKRGSDSLSRSWRSFTLELQDEEVQVDEQVDRTLSVSTLLFSEVSEKRKCSFFLLL